MKHLAPILFWATCAWAHSLQVTGVSVKIYPAYTTVSVIAHVPMLNGQDPATAIPKRLKLRLDGEPFQPDAPKIEQEKGSDVVTWDARQERTAASVTVDAPMFPEVADDTTVVFIYRNGDLIDRTALNPEHPAAVVGETVPAVLRRFTEMGIRHILAGADHILFVLGLIMVAGPLKRLLAVVTAFTLAHSLTLSLTALGISSLTPRIVEPMIALSIVAVGLENLMPRKADFELRVWLAFGFGFFHGFGFAGALAEVGLPRGALGWSLAAFNFGVELGQAGIVLVAAPLLALLERWNPVWRDRTTRALSLAIAMAGVFWFVSRVMGN